MVCGFDSVSTVSAVVRELMSILLIRSVRFPGDSREFTVTKLSLLGREGCTGAERNVSFSSALFWNVWSLGPTMPRTASPGVFVKFA